MHRHLTRAATAYHESGHVLASLFCGRSVEYVTIAPAVLRDGTDTLGHVHGSELAPSLLRDLVFSDRRRSLLMQAQCDLAGFAAEELLFGKPSNEIVATLEAGFVEWSHRDPNGDMARALDRVRRAYPRGRRVVEHVARQYEIVLEQLGERRRTLDALALALLEHERLDRGEIDAIVGGS